MKNFFLSLKTTVWTLLALVCLFFAGSYLMPVDRETYAPMNDRLLFEWAKQVGSANLESTWWFFAAVAGLVLLTINTIVCSIHAVREKWPRADFLLRVSPQVVHTGFLFILLAHLLGAGWGYRLSGALPVGAGVSLPGERVLALRQVRPASDPSGAPAWTADVSLMEQGHVVATGTLGPNSPLLYGGVGIYLKDVLPAPQPAALLMVNKDPGALWALFGSVLFILGSGTLLALKWKRTVDDRRPPEKQ